MLIGEFFVVDESAHRPNIRLMLRMRSSSIMLTPAAGCPRNNTDLEGREFDPKEPISVAIITGAQRGFLNSVRLRTQPHWILDFASEFRQKTRFYCTQSYGAKSVRISCNYLAQGFRERNEPQIR
jgi:hypothetical protein